MQFSAASPAQPAVDLFIRVGIYCSEPNREIDHLVVNDRGEPVIPVEGWHEPWSEALGLVPNLSKFGSWVCHAKHNCTEALVLQSFKERPLEVGVTLSDHAQHPGIHHVWRLSRGQRNNRIL